MIGNYRQRLEEDDFPYIDHLASHSALVAVAVVGGVEDFVVNFATDAGGSTAGDFILEFACVSTRLRGWIGLAW